MFGTQKLKEGRCNWWIWSQSECAGFTELVKEVKKEIAREAMQEHAKDNPTSGRRGWKGERQREVEAEKGTPQSPSFIALNGWVDWDKKKEMMMDNMVKIRPM